MMKSTLFGLLVIAVIAFFGSWGEAAPIFFSDRASFNTAVGGGLNFESFEVKPAGPAPTYTFPGFSISETQGGNGANFLTNVLINKDFGTYPVTDGKGAVWSYDNGRSIYTFKFSNPINAFGVDLTSQKSCTVTVGGDLISSLSMSAYNPTFFGVFDKKGTFDTIVFDPSGGDYRIGFDAVSFGKVSHSPEASTYVLFGLGSLGIMFWRKRKRAV